MDLAMETIYLESLIIKEMRLFIVSMKRLSKSSRISFRYIICISGLSGPRPYTAGGTDNTGNGFFSLQCIYPSH